VCALRPQMRVVGDRQLLSAEGGQGTLSIGADPVSATASRCQLAVKVFDIAVVGGGDSVEVD
jgi:hypothetical protein